MQCYYIATLIFRNATRYKKYIVGLYDDYGFRDKTVGLVSLLYGPSYNIIEDLLNCYPCIAFSFPFKIRSNFIFGNQIFKEDGVTKFWGGGTSIKQSPGNPMQNSLYTLCCEHEHLWSIL